MNQSVSRIGYGDTLEWSADSGTTWNAVPELKTCDIPTHSTEKVERTHMASPNRTKEYTPGLREPNDVNFTANYTSAGYEAVYALEVAGTVVQWRHTLALNDGETTNANYVYEGFVELSGAPREVDGVTELTAVIKRAGIATFTAAT